MNASCESPGSPIPHWTSVSGNWQRQQGGVGGFPPAVRGDYIFWPGNSASGELFQEIDVSTETTQIDAGRLEVTFSGWLNTWHNDADTARIKIEYRNGGGVALATFDTGAQNVDDWTEFTDVRIAPAGTRRIRVVLIAVRAEGTANDGYFDHLSLTARCGVCSGMNLLRNPGAEDVANGAPRDWQQSGGDWKSQEGGVGGFPAARGGKHFFWPGNVVSGELYQEADLSDQAVQIDAGKLRVRFSGWLNTWTSDDDTARVKVEYRGPSGTVLATDDTGEQNVDDWTNFAFARIAPAQTRKVRVRLLGTRNSGASNDAYFDDLSLVAECNVCGATLRFLDNNNVEISPESRALGVSNWVTNIGLPANSAFADTCGDPKNFRLEVEDAQAAGASVQATLQVGTRAAITYTLDKKSGNRFRGGFLRLVTDSYDDAVQGTQTVLCKLGEQVVMTYTRSGGTCEDKRTIGIGRPVTEDDNGTDFLKHDIREVKVNIVVFSKPGRTKLNGAITATQPTIAVDSVADFHPAAKLRIGDEIIEYRSINAATNEITALKADGSSGRGVDGSTAAVHADDADVFYSTTTPVRDLSRIESELEIVDERLAQCGARLKRPIPIDMGGPAPHLGRANHPSMISLRTVQSVDKLVFEANDVANRTMAVLTDAEKAIVAFRDTNANSVDVFFIHDVFFLDVTQGNPGGGGASYIASRNNTGDVAYQSFFFIAANNNPSRTPPWPDAISFAHELLHVMLDSAHRTASGNSDPAQAIFHGTATNSLLVGGTKRIGPFPTDTDGAGDGDTTKVRNSANELP